MPWGRLDDSLYDHPKLDLIPAEDRLAAVGLWARTISWCNRFLTDGAVPRNRIERLDGTLDLADQLVTAGLFDATATGYIVHDFLEFNDSRVDVEKRRKSDAERKAAWRGKKRHGGTNTGTSEDAEHDVPGGVTAGQGDDVSHRDSRARDVARDVARIPSRPVPSHDSPDPAERGGRVNPRANGTNPRYQGTNPRALAQRERTAQAEVDAARRQRRNQRHLAYLRGAISADQQADMDGRDAPLEELPDWADHVERGRTEQDSEGALAEAWVPR